MPLRGATPGGTTTGEPANPWPPELHLPLADLIATRLLASLPRPRRHGTAEGGARRRQPGLDFRELRPYQAGDEVRHIDWRVTARLGRPVTRLYEEEQEQHHWLLLDLSPALYFGSGDRLKARLACELAAALLWQGARHPQTLQIHGLTPQILNQKGPPLPLLHQICRHYHAGLARAPLHGTLTEAVTLLRARLPTGARLTLIGDHQVPPDPLCQALTALAGAHPIDYWQIRDPLEAGIWGQERLPVTSQQGPGWLDAMSPSFNRRYREAAARQHALCQARLLPLVRRLTLLDGSQSLQAQWEAS